MYIQTLNKRRINIIPIPLAYITHTTDTASIGDILLAKPSGIQVGDLLLLLITSESTSSTAQWSQGNAPSGWTFLTTGGNATTDAHYGIFYKYADGSELSAEFVSFSPDEATGYYVVVRGAAQSNAITVGTSYTNNGATSSHTISGVSGSAGDLGIFILSFDGGDGYPFSVTGPWTKQDELRYTTSSLSNSSIFGLTTFPSTSGIDASITSTVSDGAAGVQIRIKK